MSLLFYFWGEATYVLVMIASIFIAWGFGILIGRAQDVELRKFYRNFGVGIVLFLLIYFKYANFLSSNIIKAFSLIGFSTDFELHPIHLPIGISFFTFQVISYLVDVYRRDVYPQSSVIKIAVYKSFFPQLIAGPIVRYIDIADEIDERKVRFLDFYEGMRRFIIGLAQKSLIANTVGQVVDSIFHLPPEQLGHLNVWLGATCYMIQIYYDFCGYSNMAIGMARMFGFHFQENFRHPYSARSITDFWRRWHISLSTWFRDYLYIPLGGNRCSRIRNFLNLYVVFFLCGFWHGASWNFIFWGLFHGTFLVIERTQFKVMLEKAPMLLQRCYTLVIVLIGWIFFRSESFHVSLRMLESLLGFRQDTQFVAPLRVYLSWEFVIAFCVALIFCFPVEEKVRSFIFRRGCVKVFEVGECIGLSFVFLLSLAYLAGGTFNPFIYFRF